MHDSQSVFHEQILLVRHCRLQHMPDSPDRHRHFEGPSVQHSYEPFRSGSKYHDLLLPDLFTVRIFRAVEVKLGLSSALQFHGIMSRIEVVRGSELGVGESTQGIVRKKAFESQNAIVSQSQVAPGVVSGWHHHGTRQLYGFIVSGRLQLEYFLRTKEIADLNAGDFFYIPAGLIHRDLNPNRDLELVVVNILVGSGPAVINVNSASQ